MPLIELRDLTKNFKNRPVIKGINLDVAEGEVFGFLGPNGAGKTTTMRLILGLLKPTSGTATVWGQNLDDHPELRQQVGVLLDQEGLYSRLTAQSNLEYFAALYHVADKQPRIDEVLRMSGLSERRDERVGTYSAGMKRKLGLARALLNRPRLLFLDEPTSSLDPESRKGVRDLILRLAGERTTIFLNSHDLDEVQRVCTRAAIIRNGEVVANDTVKNLVSRSTEQQLELVFGSQQDAQMAVGVLKVDPNVKDVTMSDSVIRLNLSSGSSSDLLTYLVQHGVKVDEVKKVSGSLEEAYLDVMHEDTK